MPTELWAVAILEGVVLGVVLSLGSFWLIDMWQKKRYPETTDTREGTNR